MRQFDPLVAYSSVRHFGTFHLPPDSMNYKAYIDYTCEDGIHAGVYKDDLFTSLRDAEPATSHAIKGYLEVRLNENIPRSWDAVATVLSDGYQRMAPLRENSFHHVDTPQGSVELLYRAGLPTTANEALAELQRYLRKDTHEGKSYELPQSAFPCAAAKRSVRH